MKVAILAGGKGTRLSDGNHSVPKPLVEIGGRPILWHLMKYFGHFGFNEFTLALGYRAEVVKRYFLEYARLNAPVTVSLKTGAVTVHGDVDVDWTVDLVDTGEDTETGGRLKRLRPWLGDETFILTYADGLADVDVSRLVDFHYAHGKLATVTAVRAPSQFGVLELSEGGVVASFEEKPLSPDAARINGGFFVLEPGVFNYIEGDDMRWEDTPLRTLSRQGQLVARTHDSFWQCMDTPKDRLHLEAAWSTGTAPWKIWR